MNSEDNLLYEVSKLYYIENLNQSTIADKLNLSRPKVSRLLAKARQEGVVTIQVNKAVDPIDINVLSEDIKNLFNLKNVLIVPSVSNDELENLRETCKVAAPYFSSLINDGDKIGISWGYTLLEIAKNLPFTQLYNSSIVQISGNLDDAYETNFAHEIQHLFVKRFMVSDQSMLPCPIIVESPIITDLLSHDSKISYTLSQIKNIDVAFVSIGLVSKDNCLYNTGYLKSEDLDVLREKKSVGAICSRFIDIDGNIVHKDLDERTFSATLDTLKQARISCVAISFESKILPLIGAIRAGAVNSIAVDSNTAASILKHSDIFYPIK